MTFPNYLPFVFLLAAVLGLWIHRTVWIAALVVAIASGYFSGALQGFAALWIAVFAGLAFAYQRVRSASPRRPVYQAMLGAVLIVYAVSMGLALLPGFNRVELVAPTVLSEGAAPF